MRLNTPELLERVKAMEDYLGPQHDRSMDHRPDLERDRWIMENCMLLKERQYPRLQWGTKKTSTVLGVGHAPFSDGS